jgi:hypothetical protein
MSESRYRVLLKRPYHRVRHDPGPAKDGKCTVKGGPPHHPAKWSIYVRSTHVVRGKRDECWLASCDECLPPMGATE